MERAVTGRRRHIAAAMAVAEALLSCEDRVLPPRGQLVVHLDTDAPLALEPGAARDGATPLPLFDRARVDILRADGSAGCAECVRDFAIDRAMLEQRRISFGITADVQQPLSMRVRLFRGTRERGGVPQPDATIDRVFALPAIGTEGIVAATAFLSLADVGKGPNEEPLALATGAPGAVRVHPAVVRRACASASEPGEVCIRALAYWMSDPRITPPSASDRAYPERVVALSPFWIDDREVTVASMRASGVVKNGDPTRRSPESSSCTYTDEASNAEDLPVTCASHATAAEYCAAKGARLPTEAELEALQGGLESRRFVWGEDDPECEDMVFARLDPRKLAAGDAVFTATCSSIGIGPTRAGTARRDVLEIDGARIFDIGGNVAELVADVAAPFPSECWPGGLLVDPLCEKSKSTARIARGASYAVPAAFARSTTRTSVAATARLADLGFRCVRPGL